MLGKPEVKPIKITIPVRLRLHPLPQRVTASFAGVDIECLQQELFKQLPKQDGQSVIVAVNVTHKHHLLHRGQDAATLCCSWGNGHGIDSATGQLLPTRFVSPCRHGNRRRQRRAATHPAARGVINDPLHTTLYSTGRNVPGCRKHLGGCCAGSRRPGRPQRGAART